jgi:molybdate transport system substrate-binding protein
MERDQPIQATELRILCAGAMHPVLDELMGELGRLSGRRVVARFASSGGVKARVQDGEAADVVITTSAAIEELGRQGKVIPMSATAVARSAIGVAVRSGAARPDIGSVDAFRLALRQARSIAIADPATGSPSGNHLARVLDRLGMTPELGSRIVWVGGAAGGVVVVGDVVARGEADIGLQQIGEILAVPGIDLVGALPTALQHVTVFSAAVAATASDASLSRRVIDFLSSPTAASVINRKGMEPA